MAQLHFFYIIVRIVPYLLSLLLFHFRKNGMSRHFDKSLTGVNCANILYFQFFNLPACCLEFN